MGIGARGLGLGNLGLILATGGAYTIEHIGAWPELQFRPPSRACLLASALPQATDTPRTACRALHAALRLCLPTMRRYYQENVDETCATSSRAMSRWPSNSGSRYRKSRA